MKVYVKESMRLWKRIKYGSTSAEKDANRKEQVKHVIVLGIICKKVSTECNWENSVPVYSYPCNVLKSDQKVWKSLKSHKNRKRQTLYETNSQQSSYLLHKLIMLNACFCVSFLPYEVSSWMNVFSLISWFLS